MNFLNAFFLFHKVLIHLKFLLQFGFLCLLMLFQFFHVEDSFLFLIEYYIVLPIFLNVLYKRRIFLLFKFSSDFMRSCQGVFCSCCRAFVLFHYLLFLFYKKVIFFILYNFYFMIYKLMKNKKKNKNLKFI